MAQVVKYKCKTCPILTANAGGTCTKCLDHQAASRKGAATVRLLRGGSTQVGRAQQLGRAARALRCMLPRRSKEDWS